MPLFDTAVALIRLQLEEIQKGNRVRAIYIGKLTETPSIIEEVAVSGKAPLPKPGCKGRLHH